MNSDRQNINRPLYGSIERGDTPLDSGFGAEFIDIEPTGGDPVRVRVEDVPQDTIATSPDDAAKAARAIQSLSGGDRGNLGFRVEYSAD